MKTKLISLLLFVILSTFGHADLPDKFTDLVKLYGRPKDRKVGEMKSVFESGDITIYMTSNAGSFSLEYDRQTPFSDMEIEGILKDLAPAGKWAKSGQSDWSLDNGTAHAHWDGENKLTVQ